MIQSLLDQAKQEAEIYESTLQAKDLKIQALILELAHLRRLRYGVKTKHYPVSKRICSRKPVAKISRLSKQKSRSLLTKSRAPRSLSLNDHAQAVSLCRRICHALSTATNRNPANVVSAVRT
jgi:hypothetical protein